MKKELTGLLKDAYSAPEPVNKEEFIRNLRPREISIPAMLLQQAAYIRLHVWLLACAVVALAVTGALLKLETTEYFITMIMPFTAGAAVLETERSGRCGMTELEMATRFSLSSVIFARMTVLGMVSILVLCISSPVIALTFGRGTIFTAVRILIPYLITMIISLRVERSPLGRETGYASLVTAFVMAMIVFWMNNVEPEIVLHYLGVIEHWGIPVALILTALTVMEQWKTINTVEAFA